MHFQPKDLEPGIQVSPCAERLVGVDLLRAWAIAQVIGVHINNAYIKAPLFIPAIIVQTAHWTDGVTLFFVVSGFLITRTIMQREPDIHRMSLRAFYARRIARIQPLLLASIGLGALMLTLGFTSEPFMAQPHAAFDGAFWLSLVTFWFNWLRMAAVPSGVGQWGLHWDVMWSLAVEEQFYLLLPAALILTRTRSRFLALLLSVIAFCAVARNVAPDVYSGWAYSSFAGFDALGIGVLAALVAPRFDPKLGLLTMFLGLVLLICGTLMPDYDDVRSLVIIIGAAAFILGVQARDVIFGAALWRVPARIGALSYELYLLHPIVLALLAPLFVAWSLSFGAALALSVAVGGLVAHGVEVSFTRPMNRLIRRSLLRADNEPLVESARA